MITLRLLYDYFFFFFLKQNMKLVKKTAVSCTVTGTSNRSENNGCLKQGMSVLYAAMKGLVD